MILYDYHVHSNFSSDSSTPMEEMIEKAIKLGLKTLCFTDHMDYDYPYVEGGYSFIFDPEEYLNKLNELKYKYRSCIKILTGIELGLKPGITEEVEKLVNKYPFDFIIGSSHVVNNIDPYYSVYWEGKDEDEMIHGYFETIIENCKAFPQFHVYGHIDYIVRYSPSKGLGTAGNTPYSYHKYADILDKVLTTILSLDKGIEINTSGLKYGLGYAHPKTDVLKRYRELGGELITIGSDAHKPEHLCYDFSYVEDLLKSLGFKYYATFEAGKPNYIKL
ncbi:MAG: histidinol-phosphatase HisJ family protein [Clostridiales bacterium]|nr:histidinol-phosphatase HisJ family protein [Clostridiales bacterium]